jgi:acyl carrier protein
MLFRWLREGYRGRLYNVYGPTETTVWSTARDLTRVDQLDIGTPISNTQIYILDRNGSLQPIGVSGELCISGDGAARGYLNNPELTAEKFIDKALGSLLLALRRTERARNALRSGNQPGTFQEIPGAKNQELRPNRHTLRAKSQELRAKLYKTGDLARWLPDGNIQCLGRMDNQVKVRGFRVELGEIESRLLKYPGVGEAVAAVRDDARGNQCLCAYIVLKGEFKPTVLREHLSRELPDYMIPSHFIPIDAVPLTPNGKVNRGALPDPRIKSYRKYRSPRDEVEEKLVKIWTEILGGSERDKGEPLTVGVEDHFFEMGGHSLKATRLVSRIHKVFNLEIPIGDIFKMPVLGDMAAYIRAASAGVGKGFPVGTREIKPVETREYYPMSSSQQRLFILNEAENITTAYNMFGAVVAEGPFIKERVENACRQLIHRQETLRTSFPIIGSEPVQRVHDNLDFFIEYDGKLLGVRSPVTKA